MISTVFVIAAEPPHSVTNHVANDPEGILDSICSAMSTIANNNAVSSGHCAVVIGPEHARTIAAKGWTRHDVRNYLRMHAYNLFSELSFDQRYGKIYNRNLPRWYKREPDARIPIVPSPDHIHLFVIGGASRTVFGLHPRLGPHVVAGIAQHRNRRRAQGADLRRRHVLPLAGLPKRICSHRCQYRRPCWRRTSRHRVAETAQLRDENPRWSQYRAFCRKLVLSSRQH